MPLRVGCRASDADKHSFDVNHILFHKGRLYSGADDGKIKAWNADLKKLAEVQSNEGSVLFLAASDDTLYSCSNEGTVKSFDLETLKKKEDILKDPNVEVTRIAFSNGCLYAGDTDGNIKIWKNGKSYGTMNLQDGIKDMLVFKNFVFTVKDLDVYVMDLDGGPNSTFMGRKPLAFIGDKVFAFTHRDSTDIILHENNPKTHFKGITRVMGAHEKPLNAMAGANWNGKEVLFSGGWDKLVKKWNIDEDMVKLDSSCGVDMVVNTIAIGRVGEIYVGGNEGHISRVQVE